MPTDEGAGASIDRTRKAILKIHFNRGGTVSEVAAFLGDLDSAYTALYALDMVLTPGGRQFAWRNLPKSVAATELVQYWLAASWRLISEEMVPVATLPEDLLEIASINIHSPGIWEVLGGLNPLQQISESLNDRHKRRQDRDFREAAEKKKLEIDNDLAQAAVWEKENAAMTQRIRFLQQIGYTKEQIRAIVWDRVGKPLVRLGHHQDTLLITDSQLEPKQKRFAAAPSKRRKRRVDL